MLLDLLELPSRGDGDLQVSKHIQCQKDGVLGVTQRPPAVAGPLENTISHGLRRSWDLTRDKKGQEEPGALRWLHHFWNPAEEGIAKV